MSQSMRILFSHMLCATGCGHCKHIPRYLYSGGKTSRTALSTKSVIFWKGTFRTSHCPGNLWLNRDNMSTATAFSPRIWYCCANSSKVCWDPDSECSLRSQKQILPSFVVFRSQSNKEVLALRHWHRSYRRTSSGTSGSSGTGTRKDRRPPLSVVIHHCRNLWPKNCKTISGS